MEKIENKRSGYVSKPQKIALIDFIENHKAIIIKKLDSGCTIKAAAKCWEEAASMLNAIPGSNKSWQNWRKCWQDMRNEVRAKISKNKILASATGGGAPQIIILNDLEERISEIIGDTCIFGQTNVQESIAQLELPPEECPSNSTEEYPNLFQVNDTQIEFLTDGFKANLEETEQTSNFEIPPQAQSTTHISDSIEPPGKKRKRNVAAQRLTQTLNTAEAINKNMEKKIDSKEAYYKKKLELLERIAAAKETSSQAKLRIAVSLEHIEKNTEKIMRHLAQ